MNLTEIIFVLSTYLITFLIVSFVRFFLELPPPGSDDKSMDHRTVERDKAIEYHELKRKGWWDYLLPFLIILPTIIISALLTYFIYRLYPFEPTIPNFVTIIGCFFSVFIAFYFLYNK